MNTYEIITNRIIETMAHGQVPWHKPWSTKTGEAPMNLMSKKEYRGINVFMLLVSGYASQNWLTYKQTQAMGGQVSKGEKGWPIIFWKWLDVRKNGDSQETDLVPMLRYYTVFNIEQCSGVTAPSPEKANELEFKPIETCEKLVAGYRNAPTVGHKESRAYYVPTTDSINMPDKVLFENPEEYYSTAFSTR